MDDWRYENLKTDMRELREEIGELRKRSYKLETWQDLLPLRMMLIVCWLGIIGLWVVAIAR